MLYVTFSFSLNYELLFLFTCDWFPCRTSLIYLCYFSPLPTLTQALFSCVKKLKLLLFLLLNNFFLKWWTTLQLLHKIQGYSKWLLVSYTIHSRCNPMGFLSMGLRQGSGLCSSSSHKYPGTEGTNQNHHWNHHHWHVERTWLLCWCL